MSTDLLSFEHPSVLILCSLNALYDCMPFFSVRAVYDVTTVFDGQPSLMDAVQGKKLTCRMKLRYGVTITHKEDGGTD